MYKNLVVAVKNKIAEVTITRPNHGNDISTDVLTELADCFDNLERNIDVAVVILTGEGSRFFGKGAHIPELANIDSATAGKEQSARGQATFNKIADLSKPVIAAVNGFAMGGSCELALACHIRIADADKAKFSFPEITLGIIPGYGGTQRLTRLVGTGNALELMLTGAIIDAKRAQEMGLVNSTAASSNLLSKCKKMAKMIANMDPSAVKGVLKAVGGSLSMTPAEGQKLEAELFGELVISDAAKKRLQPKLL